MGKRTNTAVWSEKHSRWQINVQKDGKRRSFYSGTLGRVGQRECNAKADAWLDDNIDSSRLRMERLCDDYIADLKLRTSQSHWRPENIRIEKWVKPHLGHLRPENVTEQMCQDIINKAYSQSLSKKTLTNIRSTIMALFKYCRKRNACRFRPEELQIPRGAIYKERTILQPSHLVTLFSISTTERYGKRIEDPYINFYRFAVVTGYRPGEIRGFMPNDFDGRVLQVRRSVNIYDEVTPGKNDNARRSQELTPIAKAIWENQMLSMSGIYVFCDVQEESILKRWKKYCQVNGLPPVTLYELRHTFVSAVQSLPEAYIKNLVGHSKSMDTGSYTHAMDDTSCKIAASVQQIFSAILTPPSHNETGTK